MTTQTSKINIGTLIHGTLNETDLLTAFATELSRVSDVGHEELRREAYREAGNPTEHAHEVINDLMDALNEYAPPHTYFGAIEGDGSDFGFWPDVDSFEDCEKYLMEEPSHLRGDTEWFDLDCGVIVQVNDHGNVTVSQPYCDIENHKPRGTNLCEVGVCLVAGHEIWSAV